MEVCLSFGINNKHAQTGNKFLPGEGGRVITWSYFFGYFPDNFTRIVFLKKKMDLSQRGRNLWVKAEDFPGKIFFFE